MPDSKTNKPSDKTNKSSAKMNKPSVKTNKAPTKIKRQFPNKKKHSEFFRNAFFNYFFKELRIHLLL